MASKRTVEFEILAETRKATKNLQSLQKDLKKLDAGIKTSQKSASGFSKAFDGLAKIALGFVGIQKAIQGVTSAITTIADFETQIAKLGAITQASTDDLALMEAKAKELGATTQYTASQVAEGMNFLAMAGYETNEILDATGAVLNLATVGMMDLGQAADIASNVVSGFNLEATDTERVVDVMAKTITSSNTNIQELGAAMSKVAPVAAAMNMSVEETSALLGTMADSAIKAETAGTQLKMALIKLGTDKTAADMLEQLDVKAYDATGKFKGMVQILKEMKPALDKMSEKARNAALVDLFGKRALASANVWLSKLDEVEKKYESNKNAAGTAAAIAAKFMDTLSGSYKEFQSALESVILEFSDVLIPILREAIEASTDWLRSLSEEDIKKAADAIQTVVNTMGLLIEAVKLINDLAMPDWLAGKKDAGLTDTTLAALEKILWTADKLKQIYSALFEVEDQLLDSGAQWEDLAEQVKYFAGTAQDLEVLSTAIQDQIAANKKLIAEWSSTPEKAHAYAEAIKILKGHNDGLLDSLEDLMKIKYPHKAQEEGAEKASEAEKQLLEDTKRYSSEAIDAMTKAGKTRVKEAEKTLKTLTSAEAKMAKEIEKEYAAHIKRLLALDRERIDGLREAEFDILDIRRQGMKEYESYNAAQAEADKALAKARELLEQGKFKDAEAFFSRYQSLVRESAGTEIKEGEVVKKTKAETAAEAIKDIQEEKKFIEEMYAAKKAAEDEAYRQKLEHQKAELDGIRAQIAMQKQLIEVVNALVEVLGGTAVDIDTKEGVAAIDFLKERSEALDAELTKLDNKQISPTAKADEIIATTLKVKELKDEVATGADLKVKATDESKPVVDAAKDNVETAPVFMTISSKDGTKEEVVQIKSNIEAAPAILKITAADETQATFTAITGTVENTPAVMTISAKDGTKETETVIRSTIEGAPAIMKITAEDGTQATFQAIETKATNTKPVVKIDAEGSAAETVITGLQTKAEAPATKTVDADTTAGEAKVAALDTKAAAPVTKTVNVEATAAETRITALDTKARAPVMKIINVDTASADAAITALNAKAKEPVSKKLDLDTKAADAAIKKIETSFKKPFKMKVDADTKVAEGKVAKLQKAAAKSATMKVDANTSAANGAITKVQNAAKSPMTFTVNANTSAAQSAINALKRPTSSRHTVYVTKVYTNATGGAVGEPQRLAAGGFSDRIKGKVPGHDLTGSDDVPTLLTRGEFVQNTRAVDYYGASFMSALNSLSIPRDALMKGVQRLAVGGEVSGALETRNISLNFAGDNGTMMETRTDEDTAKQIENYFRKYAQ